jgi:WD40 repeat protein
MSAGESKEVNTIVVDDGTSDTFIHCLVWHGSKIFYTLEDTSEIFVYELDNNDILDYHTKTVFDLSLSKDGTRLVSGSEDKTAIVYDLDKQKIMNTFGHDNGVRGVHFFPNGQYVLTASWDFHFYKWNAVSGENIIKINVADYGEPRCVSLSNNNIVLAYGDHNYLQLWSMDGTRIVKNLEGHDGMIMSIACTDKLIVSGGNDNTARVWDAKSGDCLKIETHSGDVSCVSISGDKKYFMSGSTDGTVKMFDLDGSLFTIQWQNCNVTALSSSLDASGMVAGAYSDYNVSFHLLEDVSFVSEFHDLKNDIYALQSTSKLLPKAFLTTKLNFYESSLSAIRSKAERLGFTANMKLYDSLHSWCVDQKNTESVLGNLNKKRKTGFADTIVLRF